MISHEIKETPPSFIFYAESHGIMAKNTSFLLSFFIVLIVIPPDISEVELFNSCGESVPIENISISSRD